MASPGEDISALLPRTGLTARLPEENLQLFPPVFQVVDQVQKKRSTNFLLLLGMLQLDELPLPDVCVLLTC